VAGYAGGNGGDAIESKRIEVRDQTDEKGANMKILRNAVYSIFSGALGASVADAQIYNETQIRTWTMPIGAWNMRASQGASISVATAPPYNPDQMAGVDAVIFSDNNSTSYKTEVFNLNRMGVRYPSFNGSKSGGYLEIWRYNSHPAFYPAYLKLDRGPCPRSLFEINCQEGTKAAGFFAASVNNYPRTFPFWIPRAFSKTDRNRGTAKVDFICTSCPASTVNTAWYRLKNWNMQTVPHKKYDVSTDFNIVPTNFVGMNSVIHSDPQAGKIEVDNLEHVSAVSRAEGLYESRNRGGILWMGYGCARNGDGNGDCNADGNALSLYRLIAYRGPARDGDSRSTSYVNKEYGFGPNFSRPPRPLVYASGTGTRGWIKLEYTGTKSAAAVPYAMKTKVVALGPWDMLANVGHSVNFSQLNIAANRITNLSTGILSDWDCASDLGRIATNYNRPTSQSSSGHPGDLDRRAGGVTIVDERDGLIRFNTFNVMVLQEDSPDQRAYYRTPCFDNPSVNRGHVRLDYLAGSCEQGGSGFSLTAIPSTQTEKCTGTGNLVVEGAGAGLPEKSGSTDMGRDEFTYVHKYTSGSTKTLVMKVESLGGPSAPSGTKAGIMIRSSLANNAYHVSVVATPQGVRLVYRLQTSPTTYVIGNNAMQAPCWLKLFKQGNSIYPYYSTNGADWQLITPIGFTATNYYVGPAVSTSSPSMANATFSNLSGF
jgi:hypothetical protein